ncbi:MAG: hypothetical protein KIS94_09185 [Chitinophagales bacterium]|nr:hypothetical protein [Chitinophagales bacterium]
MKKAAVVILTALFLVSNTEFHELLKLPLLVVHYIEHKTETPDITIAHFLDIHYNTETKDDDYKRDSQLPFKSVEHTSPNLFAFITHYVVKLPVLHFNTDTELSTYRTPFISFQLLSNIWQPPKF